MSQLLHRSLARARFCSVLSAAIVLLATSSSAAQGSRPLGGQSPSGGLQTGGQSANSSAEPYAAAWIACWFSEGRRYRPPLNGPDRSLTPTRDGVTPWLYGSADAATRERHLEILRSVDCNLALPSWWGTGGQSGDGFEPQVDQNVALYGETFTAAAFPWAIFWDQANHTGKNAATTRQLNADLRRLRQFASSPSYARVHGRPLLVVYRRVWREGLTAAQLGRIGREFTLIIDGHPRPSTLPPHHGYCLWSQPWMEEADVDQRYDAAADRQLPWLAWIFPGFDNRGSRGAEENGATVWPLDEPGFPDGPSTGWYEHEFANAMEHSPFMIGAVLNELSEHMAFEPTLEYGWTFTDKTREIFRRFRGLE